MNKKIFEQQHGWRLIYIWIVMSLSIFLLLFVVLRLLGNFLPRLTFAPCENDDIITYLSLFMVALLSCISAYYSLNSYIKSEYKNYASVLFTISAILAAYFIQEVGYIRDNARQMRCAARTVDEAIVACRANPRVLRKGYYGKFPTLTLVAPGDANEAWYCLERWSMANGSTSLTIDDSVYVEYRKSHNSDK